MSRFDYDVIFYRVFCITLLVTAFTFTVIITNVFIDIDGLLSNKEKYVNEIPDKLVPEALHNSPIGETNKQVFNEDDSYDSEIIPYYRTKRSIETANLMNIKSPAMKKMLTSKLASLLEELDKETKKEEILETTTIKKSKKIDEGDREKTYGVRNEDLLHLAMHNILLQCLLGHMDLNDVYKKIHIIVKNFNKNSNIEDGYDHKIKMLNNIVNSKESRYNEEHKFFEEIVKCKKLEEEIAQNKETKNKNSTNDSIIEKKDSKVYIKAIIEINDKNDPFAIDNKTETIGNVEGIIKLKYNGQSIKINQNENYPKEMKIDEKDTAVVIGQMSKSNENILEKNTESKKFVINKNNKKPLFDQVIEEYLEKHSVPKYGDLHNDDETDSIKSRRLKRQIKIRYFDDATTSKTKSSDHTKNADDDLYIEIETHFDGKGVKGEKKKKLVRNLIDKIQKALHSDIQEKRSNIEHIKFVKRSQDPIIEKKKAIYLNKISPSLIPVEQRQLDPIGKTLKNHEIIDHVRGETWKKPVNGPNFLSASKSVNSAEMGELNIDYDRVSKNGMSKRIQKPLNTETIDENKSNVTLFLKNIDGTGFSIGFNQYVGEPPDSESMKMFTGMENLIREYHKTYDQEDISNESAINKLNNFIEVDHGVAKRNVKNIHKMVKRSSAKIGTNYLTNGYKILLQTNDQPSEKNPNNHSEYTSLFDLNKKNTETLSMNTIKNNTSKGLPILVNESKLIKPINSVNLITPFNRKRRSLNVKKICSLKSKIKLNRYMNTKTMASKKLFLKNKRNKREINKIKIIARDKSQTLRVKGSDENIFLMSRENIYTDKESEVKPLETIIDSKSNLRDDEDSPFNRIYEIQSPQLQPILSNNFYNGNTRPNLLMSKYPHIFVSERSWSKEEEYTKGDQLYGVKVKPYRIQPIPEQTYDLQGVVMTTEFAKTIPRNIDMPKVEEIVNAIMPRLSSTNYKVTFKISPKNRTNIGAGFKEVHTTVNKSFEENGLRYFSLLNVSQISKVEKLNKSKGEEDDQYDQLKGQSNQLSTLLRLHKNKVDVQLNTLLRESKNLGKLIELNNSKYKIKNSSLSLDNVEMSDLSNGEGLINGSVSMSKISGSYDNSTKDPVAPITTIKATESETTTTVPKNYNDKLKILDTIKHNEKITIEILNKIDTNTHILRAFLQKFSEKFETNKSLDKPKTEEKSQNTAIGVNLDLTKDWKVYGSKLNPFIVSNELRNDTIPFVYAYQQNIPMSNMKPPEGLASIVYHGHIHANAVKNVNNNKFQKATKEKSISHLNTENGRRKFNETKFFIDDIDHFKVIQSNNPIIRANITINTTTV